MKDMDFQAILAVAWTLCAIGLTLALYDSLGARGWLWLGIHHFFCILGCTTEYFRYQSRQLRKK